MSSKLPLPAAPILVAGLGRAGEAALDLMTKAIGSDAIFGWDANNSNEIRRSAAHWRARGVKVLLGGDGTDALRTAGPSTTIIKSPGISMDVPLLQAAAKEGLNVIDELEVGWRAAAEPVIAVTGTNGKSTTCALISSILFAAGRPAQLVGNTQFGPPLSRARSGALIVCEVSSFQLESAPTFLPDVAVFTNLTPEHLPRHGTMNAYGNTKQRMFVRKRRTCGLAIINTDDARGRQILAAVQDCGGRAVTYGFSHDPDVRIVEAKWTMREANTSILINNRVIEIPSELPAQHNALNIAAACAFSFGSGIEQDVMVAGLRRAAAVPGRFELIDENQPFDVVIDFAHNPDGITQFLRSVRAVTSRRRTTLRTVFGAVGLPDPPKARACAEIARLLSDELILTTGAAPRSPRILRLRELRDAALAIGPVQIVLERGQAIKSAIASARPGTWCYPWTWCAWPHRSRRFGTRLPFDDRAVARSSLQLLCAS